MWLDEMTMFGYTPTQMNDLSKNHSELKLEDVTEFDKLVSIEMKLTNGKGQVVKKKLVGEEATKWLEYMRSTVIFAQEKGMKAPFEKLKWQIEKF